MCGTIEVANLKIVKVPNFFGGLQDYIEFNKLFHFHYYLENLLGALTHSILAMLIVIRTSTMHGISSMMCLGTSTMA